jgi:hypothetical protein
MEDFYRPALEGLGYDLHEAYRRDKDAVVVAYKRSLFEIVAKETVDYNDIVEIYGSKLREPGSKLTTKEFL